MILEQANKPPIHLLKIYENDEIYLGFLDTCVSGVRCGVVVWL